MTQTRSAINGSDGEIRTRTRRHWIQADLRCLMCGRGLGRVIGQVPPGTDVYSVRFRAGRLDHFSAFKPADPSAPVVRLRGDEQFRCGACGGGVLVEDVETFSTYDRVDDERPRRGRPPKPWRHLVDHRLADLDLAV